MVGKCVNKYSVIPTDITNTTDAQPLPALDSTVHYSPVEIATLVCFMVGSIQVKLNLFALPAQMMLNVDYFAAFDVRFSTRHFIFSTVRMFS